MPLRFSRRILHLGIQCRNYHNPSFIREDVSNLPDISSPHWSSEALVPTFLPSTRTVKSFSHAKDRHEQSPLGTEFLKKRSTALIRGANSVMGVTAEVRRGWWHTSCASGTAFEVGPGVFLTHNHFPGEKEKGRFQGVLSVGEDGEPIALMPWVLDAMGDDAEREAIKLDPISDPYRKEITAYHVMLKTLQQARKEGIWKPCLRYLYRWGDKVYVTDRASEVNMGLALDVGVFTISSKNKVSLGRQRMFPSRRVRELEHGSVLATIGFPNAELLNPHMKTRDELKSYLSGPGGHLRSSVGRARFAGVGALFNEERIEMIGVQNIVNGGSSGGPLISLNDDHGSFMGIAVANEMHENEARGSTYITVDHPAVISTYLQFVLPRYPSNFVPAEILEYLDQNERFCQWYVEVAWQRLAEQDKTPELQRHWSRFGNLETPAYNKVLVQDGFDDWRGIQQVHLRLDSLARELKRAGTFLIKGHFDELFFQIDSLPKRMKMINRRW